MATGSEAELGIKRRRLVLSCYECKRRKLKCDRQSPKCTRCIDVGLPELCRYDSQFATIERPSTKASDSVQDRPSSTMQQQNKRRQQTQDSILENFESLAASASRANLPSSYSTQFNSNTGVGSNVPRSTPSTTSHSCSNNAITVSESSRSLNSSYSKFLLQDFQGASNSLNILTFFPGIRSFLDRIVKDHHILGASKWANRTVSVEDQMVAYSNDEPDLVMKQLLPSENQCRHFMQSYFDHFASVYGLLCLPSFWHNYSLYWSGKHRDPACFNAILLSAMACARCLSVDGPVSFEGDSSRARKEAVHWLRAVETWQSHRKIEEVTREMFQIRCLTLLAKALNDIDVKQHYRESQELLADAITRGLHRDIKGVEVGELSLERESLRKLWSTISDLELARCMERGVPSLVSNLYIDIGPPGNFSDRTYDGGNAEELSLHTNFGLSTSSFAVSAHSIRPLRHKINNLVNDPSMHRAVNQSRLLAYHQQITSMFALLPNPSEQDSSSASGFLHRSVLQLNLHELLLLLHLPFTLNKDPSPSIDTDYPQFICLKSASSIVKLYAELPHHCVSQMAFPGSSLIRASLCLCLIDMNTTENGPRQKLIESSLDMVEQRVLALGTGLQGFWLLSAANCYAQSCRTPNSSPTFQKQMTDRTIALFSKMCLTQTHDTSSPGSSDAHLARYITQIQQASECIGVPSSEKSRVAVSASSFTDSPGVTLNSLSNENSLIFSLDNLSREDIRLEEWNLTDLFKA